MHGSIYATTIVWREREPYTHRTIHPLENVMTGAGLNDPDEAIREAERRDLEAERNEEPAQERGQRQESPKPDASDGEEVQAG